jgi:D-alanine-D-alanine ligase-like ATP-grasp enzyme
MARIMKKKKTDGPLLGKIFRKIASKIGAKVVMEPEWNIVGQIVFKNGRKRYFRYSTLDLNPVGASDVAKDKGYAEFFMKQMGYPIVPGKTFFSNDWSRAIGSRKNIDAAYRYAKQIGFPVIVKPNSGSQGVAVAKAHTKHGFYRAMRAIFKHDRVALVQTPVVGKDYRIVVLDDQVISAYQRIPLNVEGDGASTIRRLLTQKQKQFVATGRDTIIRAEDKRIAENLERQGLTMRSVIPRGERVYLLDNANLSTGGDAIDVTDAMHPKFRKIAIRLTHDMGLRFCGVDLMIDGDITKKPGRYWVLEVNAAPGLDHYVTTGKAQEKIVEDMYLEVLKAME